MFFRRRSDPHRRWLRLRMALFGLGAVLGLVGMGMGNDWLLWGGMAALAAGLMLRVVAGGDEWPPSGPA